MAEQTLGTASVFWLHTKVTAEGGVTGRINRVSNGETAFFEGLDQALLLMNEWMDEESPVPADAALRTFRTERRGRSAAGVMNNAGLSGLGRRGDARRKEAFLVRIICRQHNSWQGEVCWKAQRLYFRSALELMSLIHSALAPGEARKSAAGSVAEPVFQVI